MTIYSVVKIYQGGSTGLVQQGKHTIRKVPPKAKLGKKREIKTTLKGLYRFNIVIADFVVITMYLKKMRSFSKNSLASRFTNLVGKLLK